ncbi:Aste57867_14487 [Aphanomyces stellatus]|uniref:GTPase Der n=1 Tax=Aphanomyces stellatus TaxID=120398 RepID=A0A485L1M0_9STRA|nr:hypothetical protein As57867_014433 [Aphanomyces stellatus]VFT91309.1 Aste57867_14487 [Aphanomyces stellatus]
MLRLIHRVRSLPAAPAPFLRLPPTPAAAFPFSTKVPKTTLPERARIALVGRTNVGKSTLFNRLTKSRRAIVHNVPGTTRDRRFAKGYLAGLEFDVIDTGGLADAPEGTYVLSPSRLEKGMLSQTERALHEADLIFFLIDGREGVTEIDKHFARWLRKADAKAPIQLVANKLEGDATQWLPNIHDSFQLGMGEPLVISAEHGEGLTDLVPLLAPLVECHGEALALEKAVAAAAGEFEAEQEEIDRDNARAIKLAIVGRPNVGKSTLLNKIVKDERVLTGPEPGVTRDSVEVKWEFDGREITLVDTAGIRKFSKRDHSNQIENLSVRDTYDAISSAQVVCVVVDVSEERLIHLDLTIAQRVLDEGRALVLVANKSDLVVNAEAEIERIRKELDGSLAQVRGVPVVPISALTGSGIRNILPEVIEAHNRWDLRVTTGRLNRWMAAMDRHHPPPTVKGKQLKVKYITQVKARPPTFALFVNKADDVPESYRRFLLNQLRTEFDMIGVPARLLLRGSEDNPYKKGYARSKPMTRRPAKPVQFGSAVPSSRKPVTASPAPVAPATAPKTSTPTFKKQGATPTKGSGGKAGFKKSPARKTTGRDTRGRESKSSNTTSLASTPPKKRPTAARKVLTTTRNGKSKKAAPAKKKRTDRDPKEKKASRWSAKQKEDAKRMSGVRKPRKG